MARHGQAPVARDRPGIGTLLARALRRRCPRCGGGPIFKSWFEMAERCPSCGLPLGRDEGYMVGGMSFNIAAAEGLFVVLFVAVVILTWPRPPWTALTVAAVLAMAVMPIAFYPFSKTIWLAFDLIFNPVGRYEGEAPE